jgi:threonine aldolase
VGSVLIGPAAFIHNARRVRKRLGGGMRQAGMLAAAGLYALDHHVARLTEDHARARTLADALQQHPAVQQVLPVTTNIIIYTLRGGLSAAAHVQALGHNGVKCFAIGPQQVRMVTHLDVDDEGLERALNALRRLPA